MSLFTWFKREDENVILKVDSDLSMPQYQYDFSWNCGNENYAELLKEQFNRQLTKYKHDIAKDALSYLTNREKSALKSELKDWDGRKHLWKHKEVDNGTQT